VVHILVNPAGQNDGKAATGNAVKGTICNVASATGGNGSGLFFDPKEIFIVSVIQRQVTEPRSRTDP
jgi:hypothetical protein